MPPPSSFVDITTIPYSRVITPAEFNVANEFWFRLIIGSVDNEIVFSERNTNPNIFVTLYQSDGTTQIARFRPDDWTWWTFTVGTFYIKLDTFPVGPIAANFTYNGESKPLNNFEIEHGSILIQDDDNVNRPGIVIDSDGNVLGYVSAVPTGEIAAVLPNGYMLAHDRFGKYGTIHALILLNPDLTFNQKIIPSTPFTQWPRITNSNTDFYALNWSNGQLWKITTAGVITLVTTIAEVATEDVHPIGISPDGTIFYYGLDDNLGTIKKYVIATAVTTTLYTIPGFTVNDDLALTYDNNPGEIIVLPDGSLVTWWHGNTYGTSKIIHISSSGALLNSISIPDTQVLDHLAHANTTLSTHVKAWVFTDYSASRSKIGNLNLATGVFDSFYIIDTFFSGENAGDNNTPFGPASSCNLLTLFPPGEGGGGNGGGEEEDGDGSGLYFLEPNESVGGRHDKYIDRSTTPPGILAKKIPNPTIRTALFGE